MDKRSREHKTNAYKHERSTKILAPTAGLGIKVNTNWHVAFRFTVFVFVFVSLYLLVVQYDTFCGKGIEATLYDFV